MAKGFRNGSGQDFDDLFQVGVLGAPGFRGSTGADIAYAPRTSAKIPDVGFREADASDLSNKWEQRSNAPAVPGFNGKSYSAPTQAPTGQTGDTRGLLRLTFNANGTWDVVRIRSGSTQNGVTTLDSGTWRAAGDSSGQYTVRFSVNAGTGQGVVTNTAPSDMVLSAGQSISLYAEVAAASGASVEDLRAVTAVLTKTGSGSTPASCSFFCSATGWL